MSMIALRLDGAMASGSSLEACSRLWRISSGGTGSTGGQGALFQAFVLKSRLLQQGIGRPNKVLKTDWKPDLISVARHPEPEEGRYGKACFVLVEAWFP